MDIFVPHPKGLVNPGSGCPVTIRSWSFTHSGEDLTAFGVMVAQESNIVLRYLCTAGGGQGKAENDERWGFKRA